MRYSIGLSFPRCGSHLLAFLILLWSAPGESKLLKQKHGLGLQLGRTYVMGFTPENFPYGSGVYLGNNIAMTAKHLVKAATVVRSEGDRAWVPIMASFTLPEDEERNPDIAILVLKRSLPTWIPAYLPFDRSEQFKNNKILNAYFIGWGANPHGDLTRNAQRTIYFENLAYSLKEDFISFWQSREENEKLCEGDSGGGLLVEDRRKFFVFGIYSKFNVVPPWEFARAIIGKSICGYRAHFVNILAHEEQVTALYDLARKYVEDHCYRSSNNELICD